MVEFHFKDQLERANIEKIQKENNFQKPYPVEQFIMDFEALAHIKEKIPDCTVKGGMAVPFHVKGKELRRLSVDIDMVTSHAREQVVAAMKEVRDKLSGKITIPENHMPERERADKQLPLLTYYCSYKSNFQENAQIKIEIFYNNALEIRTKEISNSEEIIGFTIDFPITVYDHDALIGDKMTTLAFGTIGIDPQRESDVPKQIYDISNLVNSTSGQISMYEIIGAFEKIASEEISYYTREAPSFEQVLDDLVTFPESLLVKDKGRLKLNSSYQGRFSKFITELLGNTKYREYTHVSDILFLKIMSVLIQKYFKKEMDIENINGKINEIITERSRISKLEGSEETRELHKIVGKYGKKSEQGKIIKNMLPVQAYLYDQILELG